MRLILVTHDLGAAKRFVKKFMVLDRWRNGGFGPTEQVMGTPAHPATQLLIESQPLSEIYLLTQPYLLRNTAYRGKITMRFNSIKLACALALALLWLAVWLSTRVERCRSKIWNPSCDDATARTGLSPLSDDAFKLSRWKARLKHWLTWVLLRCWPMLATDWKQVDPLTYGNLRFAKALNSTMKFDVNGKLCSELSTKSAWSST